MKRLSTKKRVGKIRSKPNADEGRLVKISPTHEAAHYQKRVGEIFTNAPHNPNGDTDDGEDFTNP